MSSLAAAYFGGMLVVAAWWFATPEPDNPEWSARTRVIGTILALVFWPAVVALVVAAKFERPRRVMREWTRRLQG